MQTLVDGDHLSIRYAAQDVSEHDSGAYTGEISATMLAKLGCSYVVVGHSERREYHAETDETVNAKARQAVGAGMTPIVCVGEGLDVRKAGRAGALHARARSTARWPASRRRRSPRSWSPTSRSGRSAPARWRRPTTPRRSARPSAERLRETAGDEAADGCRILYGGSVKAANIAGIMAQADVDGALVGGASLQAEEFGGICRFYDMPAL